MSTLPSSSLIQPEPKTPNGRRIRRVGSGDSSTDPAIENKYKVPQAWAEYIEGLSEWSWFGHFTFRDYPHPERADRTWKLFTHKLNRKIFGTRYWKHPHEKGITWARGSELQRRGAVHYHALLGRIPGDIDRFKYMDVWYDLGGISRIFPFEKSKGAEYYMSKNSYAWEKGEVDLGGPLMQYSIPVGSKN
jgi:hypothetical protein